MRDAIEVRRFNAETKETTFGQTFYGTATADGGVVVYDEKSLDGPIIRQFDGSPPVWFRHSLETQRGVSCATRTTCRCS